MSRLLKKAANGIRNHPRLAIAGGAVAAGVGAVVVAPMALAAAGFGASGVVGGSLAAGIQSTFYGAWTTGLFSVCQSAGVVGLSSTATCVVATSGAAVGCGTSVATLAAAKALTRKDEPNQPELAAGPAIDEQKQLELNNQGANMATAVPMPPTVVKDELVTVVAPPSAAAEFARIEQHRHVPAAAEVEEKKEEHNQEINMEAIAGVVAQLIIPDEAAVPGVGDSFADEEEYVLDDYPHAPGGPAIDRIVFLNVALPSHLTH